MKILRVLALVLIAAGLPVLALPAAAASKTPQTITITTDPPTGDDTIWDRVDDLGDYVPEGTSTSGLPVYFSVETDNPLNPACFSDDGALGFPPNAPGIITIFWNQPGTCRVIASQPGNDQYAAAKQVVQTIKVRKEITDVTAQPVRKGLVLGLDPSTFAAHVEQESRFGPGSVGSFPFPGQTVTFKIGTKVMCTAVTNSYGDAACKKAVGTLAAFLSNSYTASVPGDAWDDPGTGTGKLIA